MEDNLTLEFQHLFTETLEHEPTACQQQAIPLLSQFLFSKEPHELFIINGYAGTGKTSLISAFVQTLEAFRIHNTLLAPTGRAAKVLATMAEKTAHTIHRFLYMVFTDKEGKAVIIPRKNPHSDTIFIVDEVSMIHGNDYREENTGASFGNRNILNDLIQFVYESENCKMIFIGDQAQLPPVGTLHSPALDKEYLRRNSNLHVWSHTLETVVRQTTNSGILQNATALRRKISSNDNTPPFLWPNGKDVEVTSGQDLPDELSGAFSSHGYPTAVVVTRSNKRANLYNREIRNRILYREYELEGGDLLMVVKNNYFWLPEDNPAGFIANGDMIEVLRIRNFEDRYALRFADALIRLVDYPSAPEIEVKVLLSSIQSESASLSSQEKNTFFHAVNEDIALDRKYGRKHPGGVSKHPYYNALQVKFAYALTCHKTQGGQWEKVFLDQGWLPPEAIDTEYLRWLYTAVTRATEKLFLLGFHEEYLGSKSPEDDSDPF